MADLHLLEQIADALTEAWMGEDAHACIVRAMELIDPHLPAPAVRPEVAKILELPVVTKLDLPAERILRNALTADLRRCIVIGEYENEVFYFASSCASGPDALWLLAVAQRRLLAVADED